jgi:predicted nuclease of predicted toxin-antitoxin system
LKLKLDENLSAQAAGLLRLAAHDVSTVREQHLEGQPDQTIYDVCAREGRALVTLDRGIGQLQRFSEGSGPGVAVLDLGNRPTHQAMLERVRQLAGLLEEHSLEGALWIVEPHRVRIHRKT